ncbi:hypothetical protein DLM46_16605 [Paraburkholderia lacunae]|uniref:Uncharacterized protein n=2 Tax=Paraburkholderia lacunae TaxID=2211104 RepID=A0A370N7U1_9BURK|nr:hypothetical protein DLM46_16605 [Paraburkholderia lacunae]
MSCCNPHREQVGLSCDVNQQLACGRSALQWMADRNPELVPQFIASLINTFPDHLALIREAALWAAVIPIFVERAASICAALKTKTERHGFRRQLEGGLSSADLDRFDQLMSAEWHRLRGK